MPVKWDPEEDGKSHINVYTGGRTGLGRFLSHLEPFEIETQDGKFASVEAYYHWLLTDHPDRDRLRSLSGTQALTEGRKLRNLKDYVHEEFVAKIKAANKAKIKLKPTAAALMKKHYLPYAHYYVFSGKVWEPKDPRIDVPAMMTAIAIELRLEDE